jgi:hypothetical protein
MEVHIAGQIKHTSSDICSASSAIGISAHTHRSVEFLSAKTRASDSVVKKVATMLRPRRPTLRSSLVYAANKEIPNRFQLCQTINKAARVLHLPNSPTESTINRVLQDISHPVSELETEKTEAAV